jgi:8-amino-7-oxononanoate synthase
MKLNGIQPKEQQNSDSPLESELKAELERLREADLWRECVALDSPPGPTITIEGKRYLHLCSNNYLDLAGHPALAAAACESAEKWGVGAGSARLVTGTSRLAAEFEAELAEFKRAEAALVFSSGYLANIGLLTALARPGDWLVCDRLNHASLIDGARLSKAQIRTYAHADANDAGRLLSEAPASARKFIVTDGVFSMDGDIAPLPELNEIALRHGAWLIIDDAHGTGVVGPQGRGAAASCGIHGSHIVQIVTLSKALGSQGGAVAGSRAVIDTLINRARSFVFETALAPPALAAARRGLQIAMEDESRRERLRENIQRTHRGLNEIGCELPQTDIPIFPLHAGTNADALRLSAKFKQAGYWITAIRPPTVEEGTARLRITVTAGHEPADLDRFIRDAREILALFPVTPN